MTLVERVLDDVIDRHLGKGLVVTRQEFIDHFPKDRVGTTGCFVSNSEVHTGQVHSPHNEPLTLRVRQGVYRVLPNVLEARMRTRGLL